MKRFIAATSFSCLLVMQAAYADAPSCAKLRSADMGWTDIVITTNTAAAILKPLGYEVDNTLLGLSVAYEGMKNKDTDLFLGNWRPVQDVEFKPYFDNKWVEVVGLNLDGAKFTLAVPHYVAEAGVKSFDDLAKFGDKFGKKIYGIEPGSNQPLVDMVKAGTHGLAGWEVVESSEQGMLGQVMRALRQKDWIVFLGWQPHPMNIDIPMDYLSGGDAEYGPNFGGSTVYTLSRPGFAADCPNAAKFFKNLVFDVGYENQAMRMVTTDGKSGADAAMEMLKAHPEKLNAWLAGVTTIDGKPGLDAVKAALGL